MKKINSNSYAGKILLSGLIFGVAIPLAGYGIASFYNHPVIKWSAKISLIIGLLIFLFFVVLLLIEFYQDKKMNIYYEKNRKSKYSLANGLYECQSCGNQTVKPEDISCSVCGVHFE